MIFHLDEITQLEQRDDGGEDASVNLSAIAEASCKVAICVLQPGDHVKVFEGEQAGVHGIVEEVSGDVVTMIAQELDIEGQKTEIQARSVRRTSNLEIGLVVSTVQLQCVILIFTPHSILISLLVPRQLASSSKQNTTLPASWIGLFNHTRS
jgi:ribosomal protein L24